MTRTTVAATSTLPLPTPTVTLTDLPLERLHESPYNKRRTWGELAELAASISEVGILEPLLARPHPTKPDHFELVFGHRRFRAAKMANSRDRSIPSVPAMVRELTDQQAVEIQCIENLQRTDLHPLEEAEGYEQLLEVGKLTADDVAARVGKSKSYVFGRLKLLDLCEPVRKAFAKDEVSASVAYLIARIPNEPLQREALEAFTRDTAWSGPITAKRASEEINRRWMLRLADAPFDRADATLLPKAGACTTCPLRTGNQKELFSDVKSADMCTNPTCFAEKRAAHGKQQVAAAKAKGLSVLAGPSGEKAIRAAAGYSGPTIDLGSTCYEDPKHRTYRALLNKAEAQVKTTVAAASTGEMHELASRTEVFKAIKPLVKDLRATSTASHAGNDAEKKRRQAAARKRVRTLAVVAAVVAAAEKKVEGTSFWPFLAKLLLHDGSHEACLEICKRRGLQIAKGKHGQGDPRAALLKAFGAMDHVQAKGLAIELAAAPGTFSFGPYGGEGMSKTLAAAVAFYKVDAAKIGAAALAKAKAEKPPPKKPAKKSKGRAS